MVKWLIFCIYSLHNLNIRISRMSGKHFYVVATLKAPNGTTAPSGTSLCTIPSPWILTRNTSIMCYPPATMSAIVIKGLVAAGVDAYPPKTNYVKWAYILLKKFSTLQEAEEYLKHNADLASDTDDDRERTLRKVQGSIKKTGIFICHRLISISCFFTYMFRHYT